MTLDQARRVVWHRLAITARNDGLMNDWDGYSDADVERLQRASEEVADIIERTKLRTPAPPGPTT